MFTDATQTTETTVTFDLIVDCGNANVKATLVKGGSIVKTVHFGSRIRFTNAFDVHLAWGGFTLGNKSVHVGDNCGETGDVIVVGEDNQGKLKYLPYLLGGVCSTLSHHMPVGSHIRFHILTLSLDVRKQVEDAVQKLTELKVDDIERKYTVELVRLLPEGAGCSYFVANVFKRAKAIAVLDIGSGTMNLSSYTLENKLPQRTSFEFEGVGIRQFKSELYNFIKQTTTNGLVNKTYVGYALKENSSKLMDGQDISKPIAQAVASWINSHEVLSMLTKARHVLATGGYVGCCGGGFKITAVREAIVASLLGEAPTEELVSRLLVPTDADVLSVLGVAKSITNEVRNEQKRLSKERKQQEAIANGQPLPTRKRKAKQADEQQPASTPETVAGVSEASASEPTTSSGTYEPSTIGMAETIEQPTLAETTNAN